MLADAGSELLLIAALTAGLVWAVVASADHQRTRSRNARLQQQLQAGMNRTKQTAIAMIPGYRQMSPDEKWRAWDAGQGERTGKTLPPVAPLPSSASAPLLPAVGDDDYLTELERWLDDLDARAAERERRGW